MLEVLTKPVLQVCHIYAQARKTRAWGSRTEGAPDWRGVGLKGRRKAAIVHNI